MKKQLALLLVLALMVSSVAFAISDPTVAGQRLKDYGVIVGDQNGNLNESELLKREESIVVLTRMLGKEAEAKAITDAAGFSDVPDNHWASAYIAYAKTQGWTNGIGDGKFGLGDHVTTQQFATFMLRALSYTDSQVYKTAIRRGNALGLLQGVSNKLPKNNIARGDVFIMMYNTLHSQVNQSNQLLVDQLGLKTKSTALTPYPLTLTDGEGRTITFDKEPQRIVSVAPSVTEIIFAIGAGNKLVGRTDFCEYPSAALDVPSIGTLREPNIEKIAESNPDVVIAATHFKKESADKLASLGIKVYILKEQESFDGVYKTILQAGQIANSQDKAALVIENMKDRVDAVVKRVKGLTPVSCYYVVGYGDKEYTATGDTFMNDLLRMAGGDNVAKDGTGWSYSLEKLIEHNPQIIMVNNKYDAFNGFTNHENYQSLDAVKNSKVYEIDGNRLSIQGPRLVGALEEIANVLHPLR